MNEFYKTTSIFEKLFRKIKTTYQPDFDSIDIDTIENL